MQSPNISPAISEKMGRKGSSERKGVHQGIEESKCWGARQGGTKGRNTEKNTPRSMDMKRRKKNGQSNRIREERGDLVRLRTAGVEVDKEGQRIWSAVGNWTLTALREGEKERENGEVTSRADSNRRGQEGGRAVRRGDAGHPV
jgi:seryl-tRNA synthetase